MGIALGILIGCVLYKYLSGIASVEETAFRAGYWEGYSDGAGGREPQYQK